MNDVVFLLTMLVMGLTLWTFLPASLRHALRAGAGPLVHALAEGVRAVARPAWAACYAGLCRLYGVKPLAAPAAASTRQNTTDARTDGRTDLADGPDLTPARLRLDRTRQGLIAVLVDSGWTKTEIREVLKGANEVIGAEVDAAIAARGALHETPIAQRPTSAKFQQPA